MAMTHDDWKKFDPTILEREEVSQDPLVIYQGHSLAWPCSSRDFVMEMGRFTDSDGTEYVYLCPCIYIFKFARNCAHLKRLVPDLCVWVTQMFLGRFAMHAKQSCRYLYIDSRL